MYVQAGINEKLLCMDINEDRGTMCIPLVYIQLGLVPEGTYQPLCTNMHTNMKLTHVSMSSI